MRKTFAIAMLGLLSTVSYASDVNYVSTNNDKKLECRFHGRDWNQNDEIHCRASIDLCQESAPGASNECQNRNKEDFRIHCSNGFELEVDDFSKDWNDGTLWLNASRHGKIATIKVDFDDRNHNEKFEADLLIANRVTRHLEGACWFRGNVD